MLGSQRLGKKILHQNLADYEMYMQLKQMKNVGKTIGIKPQGDNNSSEPTIRDQATLTLQMSSVTVENNNNGKTQAKESSKASASEVAHGRKSSHLFTQVSQKMREAFMPR